MSAYIGIDNGVTGSIGIIDEEGNSFFFHTPVKKVRNYHKSKVKYLNRVDVVELMDMLVPYENSIALIERPQTRAFGRANLDSITSGFRALEATLIVLEGLEIEYEYIDSKEWQNVIIPGAEKGKTKQESLSKGKKLFPYIDFKTFKDADGILMAEYLRRKSSPGKL